MLSSEERANILMTRDNLRVVKDRLEQSAAILAGIPETGQVAEAKSLIATSIVEVGNACTYCTNAAPEAAPQEGDGG